MHDKDKKTNNRQANNEKKPPPGTVDYVRRSKVIDQINSRNKEKS